MRKLNFEPRQPFTGRWVVRWGLLCAFGILLTSVCHGVGQSREPASGAKEGLIARVQELEARARRLEITSPPVGTVVPFPGQWPPSKVDGTKWSEDELGWKLCDGRKLEGPQNKELRVVLGEDALPDYRGYFLRCLDDSPWVGSSGRDQEPGRKLATIQGHATALPQGKMPFKTNEVSAKDLTQEGRYLVQSAGGNDTAQSHYPDRGGFKGWVDVTHIFPPQIRLPKHLHTISEGGDMETRPINVAVYWIIKFR